MLPSREFHPGSGGVFKARQFHGEETRLSIFGTWKGGWKNSFVTRRRCGWYSNPLWLMNLRHTDQAGGNCWGQIHKRARPLTQRKWHMSHRRRRWTELCLWRSRSVVSVTDLKSQEARSARTPQTHTSHKSTGRSARRRRRYLPRPCLPPRFEKTSATLPSCPCSPVPTV